MKKYLAAVAALSIALSASGQAFGQSESGVVEDLSKPADIEPPMLGIHWARGFEPNFRARGAAHSNRPYRSPNMTYHGGKIMPTAVTENIFWGSGWANSSFVGDKITGSISGITGSLVPTTLRPRMSTPAQTVGLAPTRRTRAM
jgi:hypothetical protein